MEQASGAGVQRIERIELYHVEIPLPAPLFPVWIPGYPQYRQSYTLLSVRTRDGLIGHASGPAFHRERAGLGDFIGQFLVGLDPADLGLVRERLRQSSYLGWRNSWMDVAFWDLAAQTRGIPLHQLIVEELGEAAAASAAPESVEAYASFSELRPAKARAETVERAMRLGFRAAKIPLHSDRLEDDVDQIRLARAMAGDAFELMAHAHQAWSVSLVEDSPRWDLARARAFAEKAAEARLHWLQEPLHEESWEDLAVLSRESPVPIAGGDLSISFSGLRTLIGERTYGVLTPDVLFSGIDAASRALHACRRAGLGFSPAAKGDGLSIAANMHLLVAWMRIAAETRAFFELPWEPPAVIPELRDALLAAPLQIGTDGRVPVPTAAGLGVTVDQGALRRYGERFYSLTPVRFVATAARREGLRKTAELTQGNRRRTVTDARRR